MDPLGCERNPEAWLNGQVRGRKGRERESRGGGSCRPLCSRWGGDLVSGHSPNGWAAAASGGLPAMSLSLGHTSGASDAGAPVAVRNRSPFPTRGGGGSRTPPGDGPMDGATGDPPPSPGTDGGAPAPRGAGPAAGGGRR